MTRSIDRTAAHAALDRLLDALDGLAGHKDHERKGEAENGILARRDDLLERIGIMELQRHRIALSASGVAPGTAKAYEGTVPSLAEIGSPDAATTPEGKNALRLALSRFV